MRFYRLARTDQHPLARRVDLPPSPAYVACDFYPGVTQFRGITGVFHNINALMSPGVQTDAETKAFEARIPEQTKALNEHNPVAVVEYAKVSIDESLVAMDEVFKPGESGVSARDIYMGFLRDNRLVQDAYFVVKTYDVALQESLKQTLKSRLDDAKIPKEQVDFIVANLETHFGNFADAYYMANSGVQFGFVPEGVVDGFEEPFSLTVAQTPNPKAAPHRRMELVRDAAMILLSGNIPVQMDGAYEGLADSIEVRAHDKGVQATVFGLHTKVFAQPPGCRERHAAIWPRYEDSKHAFTRRFIRL